jgi:hypothetical protein
LVAAGLWNTPPRKILGKRISPLRGSYPVSQTARLCHTRALTLAAFGGGTHETDVVVQDASGRRGQVKRVQLQDS